MSDVAATIRQPSDPSEDLLAPRGLLAPLLLLLLAEEPRHGYALMDPLREFGFDWDGPGPLYRELRAMAGAGLVVSSVGPGIRGPAIRLYELTDAGRESLARCAVAAVHLRATLARYGERVAALPE